jgi:hypothetical protein
MAMNGRTWARRSLSWPVLLLALIAGCAGPGPGAAAPARSASPSPSAVEWQRFAAKCPVLSDPPYGLWSQGKPVAAARVDHARRYEVRCDYAAATHLPFLTVHVQIARGADGFRQTEQDYEKERAAAGRLGSYDVVDMPQLGDAALALYDQAAWIVLVRVRSGNATVAMQLVAGPDVAGSWSVTAPLQEQAPTLSAVMKDFLGGLS